MREKRLFGIIVVLAVCFSMAACSSGPPVKIQVDEMEAPGLGMIYGQVRLPDPDWLLNTVMIQHIGEVYFGSMGENVQVTRDGRFVAPNLKPGKYMLAGFAIGQTRSMLGQEALKYTVEVKPGGIHFIGIYNYVEGKAANMVRPGTFDLEADRRKSSHVQLLAWAEESSRGTKWNGGIKRKLAELQKGQQKAK